MNDASSPRRDGVGAKVRVGASFFIAATIVVKLLGAGSIAFLGRLLTPFDFGVVALGMIVVGLNEAVVNRQFTLNIIRLPDPDASHFDTAFTLGAGWGLFAGAAVFAVAEPMAAMADTPAVADALRWLALIPLLDGLRNPYFAAFEKELSFRPAATAEIVGSLTLVLTSIGLAFLLRSFWAMVVGYIAQHAMMLALSHLMARRRPGLGLSRWRETLSFGGWLAGTGVLGFVGRRADAMMIGAYLSVADIGQYNLGVEVASTGAQKLARPVQRAVYPGFASIAQDQERLKAAYLKTQGMLLALVLPIGLGLGLTASELVPIAAGPQWDKTIVVLQHLAPIMALGVLATGTQPLVMVTGDTRRLFLRNLAIVSATIPALLGGLWLFGFMGVIYARIAARVFETVLTLQIASRIVGVWFGALIYACRRSLVAGAAMVVATLAAEAAAGGAGPALPDLARLFAIKAAAGGGAYVATHAALWAATGRPDGPERVVIDLLRARLRGRLRGGGRKD